MILKRIKIDIPAVGGTNCYIVQDEETKETMVIDPGGDVDKIVEMLNTIHAKLKYILLTHCHGDHIAGVNELKQRVGGKVLIHILDEEGLRTPNINLSEYVGLGTITVQADSRLNDGDLIHIGKLEFKILHTPGHTKGRDFYLLRRRKITFFRRHTI